MVYLKENYNFQDFRGVQHFPGGGGGGGGQKVLCIKTHRTCDFPGGFGPPIPPLDPHNSPVPLKFGLGPLDQMIRGPACPRKFEKRVSCMSNLILAIKITHLHSADYK